MSWVAAYCRSDRKPRDLVTHDAVAAITRQMNSDHTGPWDQGRGRYDPVPAIALTSRRDGGTGSC